MVLSYKRWLMVYEAFLNEENGTDGTPKKQNKRGVLHELLTGYHLQDGKHMEQHPNDRGETPEDAHNRISAELFGPNYEKHPEYIDMSNKAKSAADSIRAHLAGKRIAKVHWTSKPGDIERLTGKKTTQDEDPSDLYIEHHHDENTGDRFTGVSLKTVDKKNGSAPVSNPGHGTTDEKLGVNTTHHLETARETLRKKYPQLRGKTIAQVKNIIKGDTEISNAEKAARTSTLQNIASDWHTAYSSMPKDRLVQHLRKHLMHATGTGHRHIRVTTGGSNGDYSNQIIHPETHHDHILNDPENISIVRKGNSIQFLHKNKKFFTHRIKAADSSGIMGSIKGSGE